MKTMESYMQKITMVGGALLFLIGLVTTAFSAFEHITAYIPVLLGAAIAVCGWAAGKYPEKRKLLMHIAVGCAALLFLLSFWRIFTMDPHPERKEPNKAFALWASTLICFMLLGIYVQSFLAARAKPTETPEG